MKTKLKAAIALLLALPVLASCEATDATVATENIKKAADNFEVNRRVVFYNGITDAYILEIEGRCSMDLNSTGKAFNVICKTGEGMFKRHTLVLSDNVTAFVEQLEPVAASVYHYRVVFKPQAIIPDVNFKWDTKELMK